MNELEPSPSLPPHPEPQLLVSEVMERWPQTIPVFLKHRMNCIGCEMSVFEALSDAARIYGISSEQFVQELQQAVAGNPAAGDPAAPETTNPGE